MRPSEQQDSDIRTGDEEAVNVTAGKEKSKAGMLIAALMIAGGVAGILVSLLAAVPSFGGSLFGVFFSFKLLLLGTAAATVVGGLGVAALSMQGDKKSQEISDLEAPEVGRKEIEEAKGRDMDKAVDRVETVNLDNEFELDEAEDLEVPGRAPTSAQVQQLQSQQRVRSS